MKLATLMLVLWTTLAGSARGMDGEGATILVVGDSISAAYGIQREAGWVALIRKRLEATGRRDKIVNASISGETTGGGRSRLARAISAHAPDIVIIELGGNDALRGYPVDQIRRNLLDMANASQDSGAQVIIVGMEIPPNYGPRYTGAFRDVFPAVAQATQSALVPFLLEGVATDATLMQGDGIHPTAEAQPLLADNVWPVLLGVLESIPSNAPARSETATGEGA